MKRRAERAAPRRPRRKSFSKTDVRRLIRIAQDTNVPSYKIDVLPDGAGLSLTVGNAGNPDNSTATINEQQLKELI